MLDVVLFLAFGGITYYLGRKTVPVPESTRVPQEVYGPGSTITYLGKDMVLTGVEYKNELLDMGTRPHQRIDIAFVDMDTYADRHQIPEGY